jgi:hypothetical protein
MVGDEVQDNHSSDDPFGIPSTPVNGAEVSKEGYLMSEPAENGTNGFATVSTDDRVFSVVNEAFSPLAESIQKTVQGASGEVALRVLWMLVGEPEVQVDELWQVCRRELHAPFTVFYHTLDALDDAAIVQINHRANSSEFAQLTPAAKAVVGLSRELVASGD